MSSLINLDGQSGIKALLGPTNTGKTWRAIERMLWYRTGMIGLPLRLLAREVYDRVRIRVGAENTALITGEERIIPPNARYFICTVESMPLSRPVAFVAIDEVQLAGHPERGHIFTDRILNARGVKETWLLGSHTMTTMVERLTPTAEIKTHARLSTLQHTGPRSLNSLPPRSAVVAFSATQVYEIAEKIRRRKGGAAVVMGALSPRARNAQVALYQSREVQYLVATDAIGMGLNLDIDHLMLASTWKYDGREHRPLYAAEIGQIAGRAGRYRRDGTFGTLQDNDPLPSDIISAVEKQQFQSQQRIQYRNSTLDFQSPEALLASLNAPPPYRFLQSVRDAIDLQALEVH